MPPLSPEEAAELAAAMLADAVERCLASPSFHTVLFFTPAEERAWFEAAFPALGELRPQRGASLAARLAHGFDELLAAGAGRSVVAIGSDQPLLGSARIARAHAVLEGGADLVLGPDLGGGYELVGLRAPRPELFLEIEMSTPDTCARTCELARRRGLAVELLEPGYDVDVAADLARLARDLELWRARGGEREPDFPRHTARVLYRLRARV